MRLAAVTTVRNECDIIESFVRHNAAFLDCLYILDHRSTDATPVILRKLADEGLPVLLSREDRGIFYQSAKMTRLIRHALDDYPWDFIIPLDSDEFLRVPDRATLEAALAGLDGTSLGVSNVVTYVPTANDDFNRVTARAMMSRSHAPQHRFQSFWYGGPLSPYELFCLRSFIDWGHAVDLYSYDTNLVGPAGVRVCDAADLISQDEVFVYQAEGFGKGSPSAFSNCFRYKLLAEKGGWWIDTDVVCLGERIRIDAEFFARQDADFVAPGTMYFEPRHPVMLQCLEQATKLGRNVKWGDTGPRLFTRVLAERGWLDRAASPALCYPIHYSEALEVLRPSRTADLAARIKTALFLHVWNSTLVHHGVDKTYRPPKGSLLRMLTDRHPVDGWVGEYDAQSLERTLELKVQLNASAEEKGPTAARVEQTGAGENRTAGGPRALADAGQGYAGLHELRLTAPLRAGGNIFRALQSFRRRQ